MPRWGFEAPARVEVGLNGRRVLAIVHPVDAHWLHHGEAALSDAAWNLFGVQGGEEPVWRMW